LQVEDYQRDLDSLRINYKGNEDIQLRKVATLIHKYDFFTMKDGESVIDVFGNMHILLNMLEILGHKFSKAQMNMKLLDNMREVWEPKTITITMA